jgi:hypothetical protein
MGHARIRLDSQQPQDRISLSLDRSAIDDLRIGVDLRSALASDFAAKADGA